MENEKSITNHELFSIISKDEKIKNLMVRDSKELLKII
jgi:hypothetical protein